jgi:hypothetical protein
MRCLVSFMADLVLLFIALGYCGHGRCVLLLKSVEEKADLLVGVGADEAMDN